MTDLGQVADLDAWLQVGRVLLEVLLVSLGRVVHRVRFPATAAPIAFLQQKALSRTLSSNLVSMKTSFEAMYISSNLR